MKINPVKTEFVPLRPSALNDNVIKIIIVVFSSMVSASDFQTRLKMLVSILIRT